MATLAYIGSILNSRKERFLACSFVLGPMGIAAAFWLVTVVVKPDFKDPYEIGIFVVSFVVVMISYVCGVVGAHHVIRQGFGLESTPSPKGRPKKNVADAKK